MKTYLQNSDTKWHITSDTGCGHTPHSRSRGGLLWWWWWTSGHSICLFLTNTHRLSYPAWRIHYWQWTTCHPALPNKMAHPVQHHHARNFIMQHWADIRLGSSSCHLRKASQHITHPPDGSSMPSCAVLPTTGS